MPRRRITSQMGDNAFRWVLKPQHGGEWISYTIEDLESLRKLKEKKSKDNKKGRRNNARKYRFRK